MTPPAGGLSAQRTHANAHRNGADLHRNGASLHAATGDQGDPVASLRFEALGSECELYAVDPAEPLGAAATWVRRLHGQLSRFEPDSELSRFNAKAGGWVEITPILEAVLRAALDAFDRSAGLVNVAVLPALLAAGYDRTFSEVTTLSARGTHADPGAIPAPALPNVLEVRSGAARLAPGAALDLGGIAKGWIADRVVERLGANSLANMGGDLRAVGGGPAGEGWPVAFGDRTLLLTDHGAATSGTSRRRWGPGLHHLIDPRTGAPSLTDLTEVSVLAATALEAEVLAKTALLSGSLLAELALEGRALAWALS